MGKFFGLIISLFVIVLSMPMMLAMATSTIIGECFAKKQEVC